MFGGASSCHGLHLHTTVNESIARKISVSNKTTLGRSKFRMSSIATSFGGKLGLCNAFNGKKITPTDFHLYLIDIHEKIGTQEKVRIIEV